MYIPIRFELHVPILSKLGYMCSTLSPKQLSLLSLSGSHSVYRPAFFSRRIKRNSHTGFCLLPPLLCCSCTLTCQILAAPNTTFWLFSSGKVTPFWDPLQLGNCHQEKTSKHGTHLNLLPFSQGSQSALPIFQSMKPIASDFVQSYTVVVEDQKLVHHHWKWSATFSVFV